jgi:hypothetical protein
MQDRTEKGPFPDYDSPPVVETILGVQFDRLAGFKNAHLGAFWKAVDAGEWPSVSDAPPLPPQFERFDEGATWGPGVQFQVTQDPSSRLQIKNRDGDRMIQVQSDRLHFNWLGQSGAVYIYQDDGKMKDTIPHLVEIGVDAISGLQPPDVGDVILREIKQQYGGRVALVGGLDPVYTFDMGTPDEVRRAVKQAILDAAEGGGYILGTAEAIAPETPAQSLRAASEAARQFGLYA